MKSLCQTCRNSLHFIDCQDADFSFELDSRYGLDLLQMESARFQKRFWDRKLPIIPPQGGGMKKQCTNIQFVVRWRVCEN